MSRVTVMTAAMCQGNKLEPVRDEFPDRFFDTGICESHTVAFAAGQAKSGLRPIVDIYSTFLQRGYDQIFQEVSLQNLPVMFTLDRAGLTGPDGPTHHGVFDLAYLRAFPNLVVMAPGDAADVPAMLDFALQHDAPCAIRYPKASAATHHARRRTAAIGQSGSAAVGRGWRHSLLRHPAERLPAGRRTRCANKGWMSVSSTRASSSRWIATWCAERSTECSFVVTVEEGTLCGGFGSAVLETANDMGLDTSRVRRLGIPDQFIEHGERAELLADLQLDAPGIAQRLPRLDRAAGNPDCGPSASTRGNETSQP